MSWTSCSAIQNKGSKAINLFKDQCGERSQGNKTKPHILNDVKTY